MSRPARSAALVAAVLALSTAGLFGVSAANADDDPATPAPSSEPSTSPAPDESGEPSDDLGGTPIEIFPARPPFSGAVRPSAGIPPQYGDKTAAEATTSGNNFSSAVTLTGRWPSVVFNNTAATRQSGEPRVLSHDYYVDRTMWAKWKAPLSGLVTVAVQGPTTATDTGVNVYTGSSLTHLKRVGWNDESYTVTDGANGSSDEPDASSRILSLKVKAGTTYRFQVGTAAHFPTGSASGVTELTLAILANRYHPTNDDLVDAATLTLGAGATVTKESALLNGATVEGWEPVDNNDTPTNLRTGTIWYKWTAPQDGTATFSTCAFFANPSVQVFSNDADLSGTGYGELAAGPFDQATGCFLVFGGGKISFPVIKSVTYFLQVAQADPTYVALDTDVTLSGVFSKPYIDTLSKTSGGKAGGTTVTITGQSLSFGGQPTVKFGTKTATLVSWSATSVTVKTPKASKAGAVSVVVTSGPSSNSAKFTYK